MKNLLALFLLFVFATFIAKDWAQPNENQLIVETEELALRAENGIRNYSLKFINNMMKKVCQVTFQVKVPSGSTLESYRNMERISGTSEQFTLSDIDPIFPGQSYDQAGITVNGNDGQAPEVTIIEINSVLSTEKCPKEI
ncbi:hypothetical protein niasHT_034299 [Heterodera trifolii]|uniref:Uncharacterized protein n=1 Tax=Heterodera trifolii TaxID=157864 RepID=A0ABD2HPU4_9BILA